MEIQRRLSTLNLHSSGMRGSPTHESVKRLATFGFGRHFCSGQAFARAQERVALRALLERFPRLELAAEPEFSGWEFRAPRELRVRLA